MSQVLLKYQHPIKLKNHRCMLAAPQGYHDFTQGSRINLLQWMKLASCRQGTRKFSDQLPYFHNPIITRWCQQSWILQHRFPTRTLQLSRLLSSDIVIVQDMKTIWYKRQMSEELENIRACNIFPFNIWNDVQNARIPLGAIVHSWHQLYEPFLASAPTHMIGFPLEHCLEIQIQWRCEYSHLLLH